MEPKNKNVSRRRFIHNSTLAAATITSFNVLPSKNARAAEPIKVGLIGCGGRGRGAAQNCLRAAEGVQIVSLGDIFPDRIKRAQNELSQRDNPVDEGQCFLGWDAYKKVLQTDIDYVILATPPIFRPFMLEAAVNAKKHVFMEKPAAVDPPGIRKIIAAGEKAKKTGLSIVAGTQRRHHETYIETIKRIQDGAIGDIHFARAFWCGGPIGFLDKRPEWSDVEYQIRNWYHFLWLSGDHIVEQHVHNLDVINWVLGKKHPEKAYAVGGRAWQERGNIWDHHAVNFEYDNGVHMISMSSQTPRPGDNYRVQESVHGTKGFSNCSNYISGPNKWKFEGEHMGGSEYIQEHTDLIASIRKGEPLNEAENVACSTMTAIMGRMAGYQNKEMSWNEAINSNEILADPEKITLGPNELAPVAIPGGKKYTGEEGWKPG